MHWVDTGQATACVAGSTGCTDAGPSFSDFATASASVLWPGMYATIVAVRVWSEAVATRPCL